MKVAAYILTAFMLLFNAALEGVAVMYLWLWYVVPVFGLPALSIEQALGISILVGCMSHQVNLQPSTAEWDAVVLGTFNPLGYLACGWLLRFLL